MCLTMFVLLSSILSSFSNPLPIFTLCSPPAWIGAVKRIIEPGALIVGVGGVVGEGWVCPSPPLSRRDLVYIVHCVVRVIEIVEVLIELIVVSGDEIMRLVLAVVRWIQRGALSEEVFQPTGGDGEAWLVIRAAALPPEDRLLWGHVHRHRVLAALGVGAGLLSPLN